MMHIAIHDAVNAIDRRFQPYILDLPEIPGASVDAAVATAARDVLVSALDKLSFELIPGCKLPAIEGVEDDYIAALGAISDGAPKTQGIVIGRAAAAVVLALRIADGSDTPFFDFGYPDGTKPGEYRSPTGSPLASRRDGGISHLSCSRTAPSFGQGRPMRPPVSSTRPISTKSNVGVSKKAARECLRKLKSPIFGWRAHPCSGTASRVPSLPRQGSINGRTRGCSHC